VTDTGHVPAHEQCGPAAVPEHHNRLRDLAWPEIMAEPLDWDEWCRQRGEAEASGGAP